MDGQIKDYTAGQKQMFALYDKVYKIQQENLADDRHKEGLQEADKRLTLRVTKYINTCRPGIFDLRDTWGADHMEFLSMAYYSLLGVLPDENAIRRWEAVKEQSAWSFRKAVMEQMMQLPDIEMKGIVIRNNIYLADEETVGRRRQSLKQRILFGGYRISRKLPDSIKVPLKKIAVKVLMR